MDLSPAPFSQEQYDSERASFARSPEWELRNIKQALTSFRLLNSAEQEARLQAVTVLLKERAAAKRKANRVVIAVIAIAAGALLLVATVVLTVFLVRAIQARNFERDRDRCTHQWKTTGAHYNAPTRRGFQASGFYNSDYIDRLIRGWTIVTQKCSSCGKVRTNESAGQAEVPGYSWKKVS